ncbi:MAG: DEAD/DEAH box helicase [Lachnospiraceae bacterium]|nr:DEAD/DEAH box helicase [Lachnospiraceae bacterium]
MPKRSKEQELNAFYTPSSFSVEIAFYNDTKMNQNIDDELKYWKERFEEDKYLTLFHLGFRTKEPFFSSTMEYLYHISDQLLRALSKRPDIEFIRDSVKIKLTHDEIKALKTRVPFAIGMEYVDESWIERLWEKLLGVFQKEIKAYIGTVAAYFIEHNAKIHVAGRVFFHLVEDQGEQYPFAFVATYATKPVKGKKIIHTPLKHALDEFKDDEDTLLLLLSTVTKVAEQSDFISQLLESGKLFTPLKLTAEEAYTFLKEIELYEEAGIMCSVPDWWQKKKNTLQLNMTVGEKVPAKVGLDAILDFAPSILMGDTIMVEKELREFLTMAEGLILYKGKWIEINKKKLEAVLAVYKRAKDIANDDIVSLGDVMRMELNFNKFLNVRSDEVEVSITNGQWLQSVKETLLNPATAPKVKIPPTLKASLRGYQKKGYQWLYMMSRLGLGACLADDMGLGKTVQVIAFLEYIRIHQKGKVLLVLPASLIGNWQKELEKFAPELPYQILHKSVGKGSKEIQLEEGVFLYITTYGMVSRLEELQNRRWDVLILDEAQAIKNPGTKQTKRVKAIPAMMKIAMTGTPIENRLSDLWSLFDFLNQGLLGTAKEFTTFSKGIGEDASGYAKLRKMVNPFILRRLKTDKKIISDLPDKMEKNEYATMSKKQIVLYKKLIKEIETKLKSAQGIERKGLVLSSIMKFKQICNHPAQYLGQEEYRPEESGKFEQLKEICETIYEKRERVLVFTQFREMTEPLSEFLTQIFHKKGFVFHGGTTIKNRNMMVEQFNSESYIPYMVLSLKAGGVGLNLTAANHVVHFDRWWNPAVENQATDRAFRIGQTKNVLVHKFVTKGTIEEKIDRMIEEKQKLAGDILSTGGEQWITELDNERLMELFTLGGDVK